MTESAVRDHFTMVIPPAPWTQAMIDGSVKVAGITWNCVADIDNAPDRFIATNKENVHLGENGIRRYVIDFLKGAQPTALPLFFGREVMHRNIIVRDDGSIRHFKDLEGKTLGSRLTVISGTGAAVLMMLELAYDVDLTRIRYRMGDPRTMPSNPMGLDVQEGPRTDQQAFDQLLRGELDGVVVTTGPRYFSVFGGGPKDEGLPPMKGLRPLVTEPKLMADTYERTRLYPITDIAVAKGALADRPGTAAQVMEAFREANALASQYRPADEEELALREIALFGEDPHVYGLGEKQRMNIQAFIDFLFRLGAIEKTVPAKDLFLVA